MSRFSKTIFPVVVTFPAVVIMTAQGAPTRVSGPSPFAGCSVRPLPREINYVNTEVEPYTAVNPTDTNNLVVVWQQDRWTYGGARGLLTAVSHDQGRSWRFTSAHFSSCAGGTAALGGNYERATDPWVTFSPNGTVYQSSISFDAVNDADQAILVSRSTDGGGTWSEPLTLMRDTSPFVIYDKDSITADPTDANLVYAIWNRLVCTNRTCSTITKGPSWFTRTTNGGAGWEPARIIYDPGQGAETYANRIAVLPDGTLANLFVQVNQSIPSPGDAVLAIIRSTDKGVTWSSPAIVSTLQSIGIVDTKTGEPIRTGDLIPSIAVDNKTAALYVSWQDARFSGGLRDGILFSKSTDAGLTWSVPVQVNRATRVQAFSTSIAVADAGIAVTYYDFRYDNTDPRVLLTNYWQTTSGDAGQTWNEIALGGPFNMRTAPIVTRDISSPGFFIGDYQGLAGGAATFFPLFVMSSFANLSNRTDVFLSESSTMSAPAVKDTMIIGREEHNSSPQGWAERIRSRREIPPRPDRIMGGAQVQR